MSNNSRVMNSLVNTSTASNFSNSSGYAGSLIYVILAISIAGLVVGLVYYFMGDSVQELWNGMFSMDWINSLTAAIDASGSSPSSADKDEAGGEDADKAGGQDADEAGGDGDDDSPSSNMPSPAEDVSSTIEKVVPDSGSDDGPAGDAAPTGLPTGGPTDGSSGGLAGVSADGSAGGESASGAAEVFNISKNTFTYYDAEPLCKALGAELATYDQVKEAWTKGADWCNYGWTKGQMAVYPTSKDTYAALQKGTPEQQLSCGRPGVNGGYFDNPELLYGVNCYGPKPAQSKHDQAQAAIATPVSPEAYEFDKKVAQFKAQSESIGILPFNKNSWQ
jgi:hypothetical protein